MDKKKILLLFIIYFKMLNAAFSAPLSMTGKYADALLTNDYGILNEDNVEYYVPDLKPRPFTTEKPSGAYIYWQCFPRERVQMILEDTGFSSDDFGWKDNIADLEIHVTINKNFFHHYNMKKKIHDNRV